MGTKNFSNANDLITFSRASAGTALRKIAYGSELVTNGTFDSDISGWTTQAGGSTFTVSSGQLTISRSAVDPGYVYQTISTTAGNVYYVTFDVIDNGPIDLRVGTSPAGLQITSSGIKSSAGTYTLAFVATGASTYISLVNTSYSTDAIIDNISVKEVLFDQGTLTLFNHPADIPRIEYDADGNVLGLLVEESRTNLVTASDLPPLLGATRDAADNITSPTQELNGGLAVEDTSLNAHGIRQTSILPTAGAAEYTVSVFAKAKERSFLRMQMYGDAVMHTLEGWDLTAGTAPPGGTIQDCGNGWYRCSGTFTVANTTGGYNFASVYLGESSGSYYYTGDGSSGAYMFGFQVEAGAFPTSYIPTDGATATRSADVASIPVADFGYNQSEGTVVVEANIPTTSASGILVAIWDGDTSDAYYSYTEGTSNLFLRGREGGSTFSTISRSPLSSGVSKHAFAYDSSSNQLVLNGGSVASGSGQIIEAANTLAISPGFQRSHFKSIKYYPRRLTNAQIVELTS